MLNIERYKNELNQNKGLQLDCEIYKIRKKFEAKNGVCVEKTCSECKKENIEWLLSEYKILDDAEKRYLKGVIRPFKNKVKSIAKLADMRCTEEYIYMFIEGSANAALPRFDEGTMYKGMELGRRYTLEELGL